MKFIETAMYAIIVRTHYYLEETGRTGSFERFPYLKILTERLTEEALEMWERGEGIQAARYWELLKTVDGEDAIDPVIHTTFDLCLAAACIPEFAACLNYYTGSTATIQLACELEGNACPSYEEIADRLRKLQQICRIDWKKVPLSYASVEADHQFLAYLLAEKATDGKTFRPPVFESGEWFLYEDELQPMFARQELAEECAKWMQEKEMQMGSPHTERPQKENYPPVLQITGSGGRRFLAKHIARQLRQNLFLLSAEACKGFFTEEAEEQKGGLIRELFWKKGMLCLYGLRVELFEKWLVTEEDFQKYVLLPLIDMGVPIILCTEKRLSLYGGWLTGKKVELKPLTREERQRVLEGFASMYGCSIDCAYDAVRFRLSASEIAAAMELLKQENCGAEQDFTHIAAQLLNGRSEKALGNISYPAVRLNDLKVPDEVQKTLKQVCCSAMYGYRLFEEWGLGQQYPYGRAVTVMLSGPPGTGKTMTAHAIAGELGIPLYQVDISRVMDKYIGETEKHLEALFSFAEKTNVILFFDEADALFGKRGEVTEGKDRYANIEVAYILQRIECFEGIVVLSTNFYNNIDKAFLRRMKYTLKYQMPDETIRRSIWESCLPAEPFREELDTGYLAAQFEFTGGMIKNVVMNACVTALYSNERLSMEHLLLAVRSEYEKMEWPLSTDIWGVYGYLMM